MNRSGHADLPLHYGHVPPWLAERMARLGRAIVEAVIIEYGRGEFLHRLSDPLWFQSFGAVLGMDWHSSGITTSVIGALKKAINPISKDLGLYVCGGRGKYSRNTPNELLRVAERTGLDGHRLGYCSRLSAKVDNTAIQDGFQIYLHSFIVSDTGEWAVVQQGMREATGMARRYHWHSKAFQSFIENPHTYIYGQNQGLILNLTHREADKTRGGILEIARQHPVKAMQEIRKIVLPRRHDVLAKDVNLKRLGSIIAMAYDRDLQDFESVLLLKGCGPRTLQSLTLVSEVIYGTASRFEDPGRYSFAHGGKDGKPFPVPTKVYDETIQTLRKAVDRAKIGHTDKKQAIKSLHDTARRLEQNFIPNDNFEKLIEREWKESNIFGGKTVMSDPGPPRQKRRAVTNQLSLF